MLPFRLWKAKLYSFIGVAFARPCITQPPLDPVTSAQKHKLLCVSLPPASWDCPPLQWVTIAVGWENLQAGRRLMGEKEKSLISLYLPCTEEEPLLLTAFCMKVKLLTTGGLFRMSFLLHFFSLTLCPSHFPFSFSLPSSLLSFWSFLLSSHQPLSLFSLATTLFPFTHHVFSKYSSSCVLSSLALQIQKSWDHLTLSHHSPKAVHGGITIKYVLLKFISFIWSALGVLVAASEI